MPTQEFLSNMHSFACIIVAFSIAYLLHRQLKRRSTLPLPPSPKGLPLIGNALQIPRSYASITYHEWSKQLGTNILYLNIIGKNTIVLDNLEAVTDLLERRSSIYSSRPRSAFLEDLIGPVFSTGLLKYGEAWRQHRRLIHSYFSMHSSANYRPQITHATRRFMGRLLESKGDLRSSFSQMAGDGIMSVCYGVDVQTKEGTYYLKAVHEGNQAVVDAVGGKYLIDSIPLLKYVPAWMPGADFKKVAQDAKKYIDDLLELPFKAVQTGLKTHKWPNCFVSTLLEIEDSRNMSTKYMDLVRDSAASMYSAGTETSVTVLSSCVLGLLDRPDALRRAREDLDRVIQPGHLPEFDNEPSLPFITAIVKEALRWRDVAPLGVPHYLEVDDEYAGYRIPAGTTVYANQWALLHDEKIYPDPMSFKPERFMNGDKFNYATKDPESACWGFGRRICPGRHMAFSTIWVTLASLIYAFDIEKEVDDFGRTIDPNPKYTSGLLFAPESVPCRISPRSEEFAQLIRDSLNEQ